MPDTNDDAQVLQRVLDTWREGVNSGDPLRVSEVFTDDAIFQGLKPYSVGQEGVFDYYAGLPDGMTVEFEIKEVRRPADSVLLGYVRADFNHPDGRVVSLNQGILVTLGESGGRIAYYHVSAVPE